MEITTKLINEWTIGLVVAGSQAYGTNVEGSDLDTRGVAIPLDRTFYHGFLNRFEQKDKWDNDAPFGAQDSTVYDLRKAFKLWADCNPNMLDILFCEESDVLVTSEVFESLRSNADLFLSRKAKHTFSGYAYSQMKRLQNRRSGASFNKKASHVVRLMRMGAEILRGEGVQVRRPDAEELKHIRENGMSLPELKRFFESAEKEMELAYESSPLPHAPNRVLLDQMLCDLIEARLTMGQGRCYLVTALRDTGECYKVLAASADEAAWIVEEAVTNGRQPDASVAEYLGVLDQGYDCFCSVDFPEDGDWRK